jgi:hypothetical protein
MNENIWILITKTRILLRIVIATIKTIPSTKMTTMFPQPEQILWARPKSTNNFISLREQKEGVENEDDL